MKKTLTTLAILLALPGGAALADSDDCFVPMADWQPREAITALGVAQDWTVRRIKIDDGCYQILGRDADGRAIEVTIHPQSLQVIEFEYEDEDEDEGEEGGDHKDRGDRRGH